MISRIYIFQAACRKEFAFLQPMGFALTHLHEDNLGCSLTYKNKLTAIRIELERATITIDCYKLRDGNIPIYPIFLDPDDELVVFDVNDLFIVRTGRKVEQDPKRMYEGEYLENKVREFATLLRQHGSDVLLGDFGVLPKIKQQIVRRIKELENEQ